MGFVVGEDQDLTPQQERSRRQAATLLIPLTIVLTVLLVVFFGVYKPVVVTGPSMEPTLLDGDRLLLTRGLHDPKPGDIVVLSANEMGGPTELIKRIVATAGQVVEVHGSVATVDGRVESGYATLRSQYDMDFGPYEVPLGTVFVLGDNRPDSNDSRFIGSIPLKAIEGRAVAVFMPVTRIRSLPRATQPTR